MEDDVRVVYEKPRGEKINVYLGEFKGTQYLHIREWYQDAKDQTDKPTKKGVAIPVEKIEELKNAVDYFLAKTKA